MMSTPTTTVRTVLDHAMRWGDSFDQWRLERFTVSADGTRGTWEPVGHVRGLRALTDDGPRRYEATGGRFVRLDLTDRAEALASVWDLRAAWDATPGTPAERIDTPPRLGPVRTPEALAVAAAALAAEGPEDGPTAAAPSVVAQHEAAAAEAADRAITAGTEAEQAGWNDSGAAAATTAAARAAEALRARAEAETAAEAAGTEAAGLSAARARWGAYVAAVSAREAWDQLAEAITATREANGDAEYPEV